MEKSSIISDNDDKSFVTPPEGENDIGWVSEPTDNDVLCGRGGSINSHPGNERFRDLVEKRKRVYLTARFKREKRLIASSIVSEIRNLSPPGRFLSRDSKTNKWKDIGDEKARDKTSQALRENAPTIRAEIETEIKVQRAEMQRAEVEEVARIRGGAPPPPHHPYYSQGWDYHSYYGYPSQQSPHAPPPPPPPGYYEGHWGPYPPPPPPNYSGGPGPGSPYPPPPQPSPPPKSTMEHTADMVVSSAESIKSYFGGGASTTPGSTSMKPSSSNDGQDINSRSGSVSSAPTKPIMYVHDNKRRRVVKFREDTRGGDKRQRRFSSTHSAASNSLADEPDEDIEPENIDSLGEQNSSLMTQVANQILSSIGSWDASTTVCGFDNSDERIPFPQGPDPEEEDMEQIPEEEMAVEWEGQEVLLMDHHEDQRRESSPERMPPPVARRPMAAAESSVGFSSIGSYHSWVLPNASSIFSWGKPGQGGGISPVASTDMEHSLHSTGARENYSMGGSVGGASLMRVFEHEPLELEPEPAPVSMGSPKMSQHALQQVPSWERSLRSKSPLSLGSDDGSLISKSSSKVSESGIPAANNNNDDTSGDADMLWTRE